MTTIIPMSIEWILNYRKQSSKKYRIFLWHPKALSTNTGLAPFHISNKEIWNPKKEERHLHPEAKTEKTNSFNRILICQSVSLIRIFQILSLYHHHIDKHFFLKKARGLGILLHYTQEFWEYDVLMKSKFYQTYNPLKNIF